MLDEKIVEHFPGLVVRKDLTKIVKGNAIVPSYVLEYLLGQYCATDDEAGIESGIETVKSILAQHYVHRNEAELIKSRIKERGRYKVIDKVTVELNDKKGVYEARFSNLGLKNVIAETDYIKKHPKLLVGGVWCIIDLLYEPSEDPKASPWFIDTLKPIQVSHVDFEAYCAARSSFSADEWADALVQSIGFNPAKLQRRQKLLQLCRLIPFCERNYNYIELGPKGTGKSHIFSEFSPHGMIVSGGEVSVAKLFVNNATGKIGLLGYWDSVAFDEFAGKDKRVDKNLVDIMKNYMANKTFSRGIEVLGAEASISFLGNTLKSVEYMMRHSHFFDDLPDKYIDSAFLDRIHCYSPGWETSVIRAELFTNGFGFIVDYLAEIMRTLRNFDYSQAYTKYFELNADISTRDRDGIHKTFSGLVKVLYPSGECDREQARELLEFAIEGRKRVKDHIMRLDSTFPSVTFSYQERDSDNEIKVRTLEETQHPHLKKPSESSGTGAQSEIFDGTDTTPGDDQSDGGKRADGTVPGIRSSENEKAKPKGGILGRASLTDDLITTIAKGESKTVEFKSTLRKNLHTGKSDSSISHSALKTIAAFLNTEGGTLFIGIKDDGTPLGLSEDGFKNEDAMDRHLTDLISSAMGAAHMHNIHIDFVDYLDRRVLAITCRKGSTPAYVTLSNKQYFFCRTSASTRELKPEEVVAYVGQRFR